MHSELSDRPNHGQVMSSIIQQQATSQSAPLHVIPSRRNGQGQYYEPSPEMGIASITENVTGTSVGMYFLKLILN